MPKQDSTLTLPLSTMTIVYNWVWLALWTWQNFKTVRLASKITRAIVLTETDLQTLTEPHTQSGEERANTDRNLTTMVPSLPDRTVSVIKKKRDAERNIEKEMTSRKGREGKEMRKQWKAIRQRQLNKAREENGREGKEGKGGNNRRQ